MGTRAGASAGRTSGPFTHTGRARDVCLWFPRHPDLGACHARLRISTRTK